MEAIYAALLLHSAGKPVEEAGVRKILEAAGAKTSEAQIKALVSSLKDVNIEEAIKNAAQPVAAPAHHEKHEEKKEAKKEEKPEEKAEEAAAGLGALFG